MRTFTVCLEVVSPVLRVVTARVTCVWFIPCENSNYKAFSLKLSSCGVEILVNKCLTGWLMTKFGNVFVAQFSYKTGKWVTIRNKGLLAILPMES